MKQITAFTLIALIAWSCGSSNSNENTTEKKEVISASEYNKDSLANGSPVSDTVVSGNNQNIQSGAELLSQSDCRSCHQEKVKIVGPAYLDVAKKYENTPENIEYLAGKIINGGQGVWGAVPMPPHPDLSMEEAKKMAEYILSLKSE